MGNNTQYFLYKSTSSPPSVALDPKNLRYLSFQGGGGKGLAYLGALAWLEQKNTGCLPLYQGQGSGSSITGVSGTSAGAITALFVSLGYASTDIIGALQNAPISTLVDGPEPGVYSSLPANLINTPTALESVASALFQGLFSIDPTGIAAPESWGAVLTSLVGSGALLRFLSNDPRFGACLLFDGGFITGKKLRTFLAGAIAHSPFLTSQLKSSGSIDGTTFTFSQLKQANAAQLAVIATNLRTFSPMVFSSTTTPNFPVADAVAMSASFPFLFKPTLIGTDYDTGCPSASAADYPGLYADGGLVINVPIHVFDDTPQQCDPLFLTNHPDLSTLPAGMLGLRLSPGDAPSASSGTSGYQDPTSTVNIKSFAAMVMQALQSNANQGQLRTPLEGQQTVIIYSGGLDLLDFVPPTDPSVMTGALRNAWTAMNSYYSVSYQPPW